MHFTLSTLYLFNILVSLLLDYPHTPRHLINASVAGILLTGRCTLSSGEMETIVDANAESCPYKWSGVKGLAGTRPSGAFGSA